MGDDRKGVGKTNFYGFVKPIEYMHGLGKAVQENTVMLCMYKLVLWGNVLL